MLHLSGRRKKVRVLMYHSVSADGVRDALTVDSSQLEAHFRYLRTHGYHSISLSELIEAAEGRGHLPRKAVLITFDDGFRNNYDIAYPLAKLYQVRINLFVVPTFIHNGSYRGTACMSADDINAMDPALVEIGLHSLGHSSYSELTPFRVGVDIDLSMQALRSLNINYQPCLAYPYGAFPRKKGLDQRRFFEVLNEKGIYLAFRIGNRINTLPLRNRYLIQRIDVTGHDTMETFKASLAVGKKWGGYSGTSSNDQVWCGTDLRLPGKQSVELALQSSIVAGLL